MKFDVTVQKILVVALSFIVSVLPIQAQEIESSNYRYKIEEKGSWIKEIKIPLSQKTEDQSIQYLLNDEQLNIGQQPS